MKFTDSTTGGSTSGFHVGALGPRKCFRCDSTTHIIRNCPFRDQHTASAVTLPEPQDMLVTRRKPSESDTTGRDYDYGPFTDPECYSAEYEDRSRGPRRGRPHAFTITVNGLSLSFPDPSVHHVCVSEPLTF